MPEPVAIVLYPGASAFEALGVLAVMRAASWPAQLVGPEALVSTCEGARVVPDKLGYDAVASAPIAVLPGGDVGKALLDASLARALRARRGRFTLAGGEAIRLVAAAGLADERRVARLPGDAIPPGASAVAARLVADGRLLTCFAGDAIVDLALHLVGHEDGHEAATRAAAAIGREYKPFAFGQTT